MPILFTNLACLGIIGLFIIVFHAKEKVGVVINLEGGFGAGEGIQTEIYCTLVTKIFISHLIIF